MSVVLYGIFSNPGDALAAACGSDRVAVRIVPARGDDFFATVNASLKLPVFDPESGAIYARLKLEACR